jgi:hypothetical protein
LRHDWYLVYVVTEGGGPRKLALKIDSNMVDTHDHISFLLDHRSRTVLHFRRISKPKVLHELGWFEHVGLFTQICQNQNVPAGQDQDHVFNVWVRDVLTTITANHQASWAPNDGNHQ